MRLDEFDTAVPINRGARMEGIASLLTVLNVVISKAKTDGLTPSIPTDTLLSMVNNSGVMFDYTAFLDAYEHNQGVRNLIRNFSKDTVELIGSAADKLNTSVDAGKNSAEAVSKIAKRVAKRNIG
jgi:hypothetical protein